MTSNKSELKYNYEMSLISDNILSHII
jgi:hypothetical protein